MISMKVEGNFVTFKSINTPITLKEVRFLFNDNERLLEVPGVFWGAGCYGV
jgi:hypothetical protein